MTKVRPILFSTPMVKAILAWNKTMTRRLMKPQPHPYGTEIIDSGKPWNKGKGQWHNRFIVSEEPLRYEIASLHDCPYGKVGDILWVREMLYQEGELGLKYVAGNEWIDNDSIPENHNAYRNYAHCYIPSIHMPKWAARIWMQIQSIRVERLQDISEKDAIAEGIEELGIYEFPIYKDYTPNSIMDGYQYSPNSFKTLWISINGDESWNSNPWVWAITFKVLSTTGKPASIVNCPLSNVN